MPQVKENAEVFSSCCTAHKQVSIFQTPTVACWLNTRPGPCFQARELPRSVSDKARVAAEGDDLVDVIGVAIRTVRTVVRSGEGGALNS